MLNRREVLVGGVATGIAVLARRTDVLYGAASQPATPLNFRPPAGTTDTHRHIFGDAQKYPYSPTSRYLLEPATVDDMRKLDRALRVDRVVLIQPSGYGTDNRCLLDGLKALGSNSRGAIAIDDKISDKTLDEMHQAGVRAVRMDPVPARIADVASRIKGRGWHINTAVQIGALDVLQDTFATAPVPIVIDHYAGAKVAAGTSQKGFDSLLRLLKSGNVYMKMSHLEGPSTQAPGYADVEVLAKAVLATNHERLLWGTDWPHIGNTRPAATGVSPYLNYDDGLIFNELASWVGDAARLKTILVDNPARLYGFR
jgi:predicted TIM-barrel fold metal-dependent hydrolase